MTGETNVCETEFTLGYAFLLDSVWDFQKEQVTLGYGREDALTVDCIYAENAEVAAAAVALAAALAGIDPAGPAISN